MGKEIVPGKEFDQGSDRTTPSVEGKTMVRLSKRMAFLGYPFFAIHARTTEVTKPEVNDKLEAREVTDTIHDAAAILFLNWANARTTQDQSSEFASARLFNQLTASARKIDEKYKLFDKSHLSSLHEAIEQDIRLEQTALQDNPDHAYSPHGLSPLMDKAAHERTHENAWPWVVLPTYPKQNYGRILLDVVRVPDAPPVFVTQPTFTDGQATLFHTHGQNWAWSRPLGEEGSNRHINTLWVPHSREQLFPLTKVPNENGGKAYYTAGEIAIVPPKVIHGIAGARLDQYGVAIDALEKLSPSERDALVEQTKFGEQSSLHVYRGDLKLAQEFAENPVTFFDNQPDRDFFESNDMIVLDHKKEEAWAGGGGAWAQRMMQFGPSGDHCGRCFVVEDDPRIENLPAIVVYDRFVDPNPQGIAVFKG